MLPLTVMFSRNNETAPIHSSGRQSERKAEEGKKKSKQNTRRSSQLSGNGLALNPTSFPCKLPRLSPLEGKPAWSWPFPGTSCFSWRPSCLSTPRCPQSQPRTCSRGKEPSPPLLLRPHGREGSHWCQTQVRLSNPVLSKVRLSKAPERSLYQQAWHCLPDSGARETGPNTIGSDGPWFKPLAAEIGPQISCPVCLFAGHMARVQ